MTSEGCPSVSRRSEEKRSLGGGKKGITNLIRERFSRFLREKQGLGEKGKGEEGMQWRRKL
jgi:hypothetical protein